MIATFDKLFNRLNSRGILPSIGAMGDLYELTHLRNFKEHDYIAESTLPPPYFSKEDTQKDKNLYIIGDSFTKHIGLDQFVASKTTFIRVGVNSLEIELDKTKKNILVLQNIERGIDDRFRDDQYNTTFLGLSGYYTKEIKQQLNSEKVNGDKPALLKDFGNANINDRLQQMLFHFKPFESLKELKSTLNFSIFSRIDGGHIVSKDRKFLFYHNEADTSVGYTSSFYPIDDMKIREYVSNAQKISTYYKAMGFDEIYFVFVPNKVSVCSPNDHIYNHQIERIQSQTNPLFKTIDIYADIVNHPEFYHQGDGHWNKKGMELFVKKINKLLQQ